MCIIGYFLTGAAVIAKYVTTVFSDNDSISQIITSIGTIARG